MMVIKFIRDVARHRVNDRLLLVGFEDGELRSVHPELCAVNFG